MPLVLLVAFVEKWGSFSVVSLMLLPQEKQIMAPSLLANVSKIPQQHQDIVLRIATKVMIICSLLIGALTSVSCFLMYHLISLDLL